MEEYKSKWVGSRSLRCDEHPGLSVIARVDNIGKVSIQFGNSMNLRIDHADTKELAGLLEECANILKLEGLEHRSSYPSSRFALEQREITHRARRSAMEVPAMGSPHVAVEETSESQRVNPFDDKQEIGNDPIEW